MREPVAGAFFASDSVSEPGTALVREGIQNSLDATPSGNQTIVQISIFSGKESISRKAASPYFDGTYKHYESNGSGLRDEDIPAQDENCPLLIFEDFGTRGLRGDPADPFPPKDGADNNFFHFFRAEGRSDKDPGMRGSWGLGKDTFFRASRVNTIFGLTVRDDDRRLLMGKAILKSHYLGDEYCQDGYFGVLPNEKVPLVVPIENEASVEQFIDAFPLQRQGEPGLSVVVPWLQPEITQEAIIRAVLRNYFYTILSGELEVSINGTCTKTLLDKDNLSSEAKKMVEHQKFLPSVELAQWALFGDADETRFDIKHPEPNRAWDWHRNMFSDDVLQGMNNRLQDGEPIAVRVPVTIRKKSGLQSESHFVVYMIRTDSTERTRPTFIRDGIIVPDVRAPFMRGIGALVIADSPPLSEFLGKAENPSHTIWQGQQLKAEYTSGVSDLRFIVNSVRRIYDVLIAEDKEQDKRILSDIFPKPGRGGKEIKPPPPSPQQFTISSVSGGFRIARGKADLKVDSLVQIQAAYDIRRGSPLGRYQPSDFRLSENPIAYQAKGSEAIDVVDNRMVVRVDDPEKFSITVTGFDSNRQVYVKVDRQEDTDADPAH